MDKDKRLVEASSWEALAVEESGFCSERWDMLSKFLMQFFVDVFGLRPNYGKGNGSNMQPPLKGLLYGGP